MITEEEQQLIWHTKTLKAFSELNYDNILHASNLIGTETYITYNKKHIEGFELRKIHKGNKRPTVYFLPSQILKMLPLELNRSIKIHDKGKVYRLITGAETVSMEPEKLLNWRQIVDLSGIPYHTKPLHHTIYKMKRLYGRSEDQFYGRYVTESGFGKDKFVEAYRLLLEESLVVSDPSPAKIFYGASHNKDITINELPGDMNKKDFNKMCNLFMRIGDGSTIVDNPARSTKGTGESADTSKLSVSFTHNIPHYYIAKGFKPFFQIFPYNVYNRYYPTYYEGFLQAKFPTDMNFKTLAKQYEQFIINWIKSLLWYEENWWSQKNLYPNIPLDQFVFRNNEPRFRDHFRDFARCVSHYAKDEKEYLEILHEDYNCHKNYVKMIEDIEGSQIKVTEERLE